MKIQKIVIIILVLSMLLINVTSVGAIETKEDVVEVVDNNQESLDTNDEILPASIVSTGVGVQSKSHTGEYLGNSSKHQTDKFATYYFSNLKDNYGYNTMGSCGYVATAMMLSYYDTYLNDDIISPVFDVPVNIADLKVVILLLRRA